MIQSVAKLFFVVGGQTARQTMLELQQLIRTAQQELPDTAAAVRLSGLELSDAIEEVSLLR
jgi:hypothetical protein